MKTPRRAATSTPIKRIAFVAGIDANWEPETRRDVNTYQAAMNAYKFDNWFTPFNALLEPFGAGYAVPNTQHEALHLDLCPIMTTQLWSALSASPRDQLAKEGVLLLQRLLDYLKPDWVFFSLAQWNFDRYVHRQLNLTLPEHVSYLQSPSGAQHEVRELTQNTDASARVFWFKKTGMRPLSPAGASLRAFGRFLCDPQAPNPCTEVAAPAHAPQAHAPQARAPQARAPQARAPKQPADLNGAMTNDAFHKTVQAQIEAEASHLIYSHHAGGYSFYRLHLTNDEPIQLEGIVGRCSFVNLMFGLDKHRIGKAFLEITPHFTQGWRAHASQQLLQCKPLQGRQDGTYIRLINFNQVLGEPITQLAQIGRWVTEIDQQLEAMLSPETHAPAGAWSRMNNRLGQEWCHLSNLLPVQQ